MQQSPSLKSALGYAELGYRVFPCFGKKPMRGFRWQQHATADPELVKSRFSKYPDANIGIVVPKGVFVLDLDLDKKSAVNGADNLTALRPVDGENLGD